MRLLLFTCLLSRLSFSGPTIPIEARKALESLPEKALTVDLVLGKAIQHSDSFKRVLSQLPASQSPEYAAKAPFGIQLTSSLGFINNQLEPTSSFGSDKIAAGSFDLGLSKAFTTGTQVSFAYNYNDSEIDYSSPTISSRNYNESSFELSLSQNLWNDAFGYSSRRKLEAGELASQAAKNKLVADGENWALRILDLFYNSWLAKEQHLAAKKNQARQERLLRSTRISLRRGTAEKADLLQIESSLILSKAQVAESFQKLNEAWTLLILALKLPEEWIEINPIYVPMKLDNPSPEALRLCQKQKEPPKSALVKAAELNSKSKKLQLEALKSDSNPKFALFTSIKANGVDNSSATAPIGESFSVENPYWTVGLSFSMPLGFYAEKASLYQAVAEQLLSAADANIAKDDDRVNWRNDCNNLQRLLKERQEFQSMTQKQDQRAALEKGNFDRGRTQMFNVIQAEADATSAELAEDLSEVELRKSAWKLIKLAGSLSKKIDAWKKEKIK